LGKNFLHPQKYALPYTYGRIVQLKPQDGLAETLNRFQNPRV